MGDLASLTTLQLFTNGLSGSIPPELGNLASLTVLWLSANDLTGGIPPELGDLASLTILWLDTNDLTGGIPPELGDLASLSELDLGSNNLSGSIPPELGDLSSLTSLSLHTNDLSGALPESFLQLARLETLAVRGTSICVPRSAAFTAWLAGLENHDTGDLDLCVSPDRAGRTLAGGSWSWSETFPRERLRKSIALKHHPADTRLSLFEGFIRRDGQVSSPSA